ncbi:protein NDRG1 [Nothobranchius furzeri]|uniref:N-myc downstream regulated 1 n=1 Tax=Nothobranchius furzeri TaxID=105023 RepID=A0A9D2YW96_NOTFU|nr:N-myc downstream regulated 1 [Nothobranchius furzeri]
MVLEETDNDSVFEPQVTDEYVETQFGDVHCVMMGTVKANRPVILTFPDVGLNHKSCFETLFNHEDMHEIVRHFAVCHVEAPGQQEGAKTLPAAYPYPSMEQLSEVLPGVLKHFGLRSVIGLGVGAGAYILARFALNYPDLVDGVVLININPNSESLMDTVTSKITDWTYTLPDKILANLLGKEELQTNQDLVATYRHYITATMNEANVSQFLRSYSNRSALEVERPVPEGNINVRTLKCSSLLVVGDNSPAVEAVVDCNSKLNPTKTTLLKMADCGGLPQVDQPAKVIEALKYFIQGLGYLSSASMTRLRSRTASGSSTASFDGPRSRAHTDELQRGRIHSHGAEEKRGRARTDISMESVSTVNQSVSKSTEVAC